MQKEYTGKITYFVVDLNASNRYFSKEIFLYCNMTEKYCSPDDC